MPWTPTSRIWSLFPTSGKKTWGKRKLLIKYFVLLGVNVQGVRTFSPFSTLMLITSEKTKHLNNNFNCSWRHVDHVKISRDHDRRHKYNIGNMVIYSSCFTNCIKISVDLLMFSMCVEKSPINLSFVFIEHLTRNKRERVRDREWEIARCLLPVALVICDMPFVVCCRCRCAPPLIVLRSSSYSTIVVALHSSKLFVVFLRLNKCVWNVRWNCLHG